MKRQYHKWFSARVMREMEILVFGHAGAKALVFPTREGRFYDYENWGQVEALRPAIDGGHLRLFCVDGFDSESLYSRTAAPAERARRHRGYESYILEEVIPFMRSENGSSCLIAHGCSIGAYHAMTLALRHPSLFCKVVALSGRYDLTSRVGCFEDLFSGYYDEDIYFITPNHFMPGLNDEQWIAPMRRMDITLAVGERDPFLGSNLKLSQALREKAIGHRLDIWPGEAHRARYWREMAPNYL